MRGDRERRDLDDDEVAELELAYAALDAGVIDVGQAAGRIRPVLERAGWCPR